MSDSLHQALQLLYNASHSFNVSVDSIQRLAKHLTLDTFVDADALAPPTSRLSIAGQLLLLDVDFAADNDISGLALSSGSHTLAETTDAAPDLASCLFPATQDGETDSYTVSLDKGSGFSFFRNTHGVSAEEILRANLQGVTLGPFAANLAYLASLDRLSPPDGDLIAVLDSVALYLALVNLKQKELSPAGNSQEMSHFGSVRLNDETSGRLGVFLDFWEQNRHLGPSKVHMARLSVVTSEKPMDYFQQTLTTPWRLMGKDVVLALDAKSLESIQKNELSQNWALVVSLDTEVSLPKNLAEYLGLPGGSGPESGDCTWGNEADDRISFFYEENTALVTIKEFQLSSLHQLTRVIPAIRNQITLSALIKSVSSSWAVVNDEAEISPETSKKIRTSLKLADDVPDEELAGLNSIPNDIMGAQRTDGLEDFMRDEYDDDDVPKTRELTFSLEILYDSNCDYLLHIMGSLGEGQIDTSVLIRSGQISQAGDVDMDSDAPRFVKALALGEDVLLAMAA